MIEGYVSSRYLEVCWACDFGFGVRGAERPEGSDMTAYAWE